MPATLRTASTGASSVPDLVDEYLGSCRARGLSVRTLENAYGFALNRIFLPWCSSEGVATTDDLSQATLDRFTTDLLSRQSERGRPLAKASVHSYVRPVRQLLAWAEARGEAVGGRPQLPKQPRREREVLSRAEIDRLEDSARTERDKVIVRLFADCGLRLAELSGLSVDDIRRGGNRTYLRVRGKGDRERMVPMLPDLARRVERLSRNRPADTIGARIFYSSRRLHGDTYESLTESGVAQMVGLLGKQAQLGKPVHPHLLRHSWITEMLRRGMNPIQLAAIAGASEKVIADHYAHLSQDDAYDAMAKALSVARR
ncbi:MAG: tyrosine-type recombinase/integrase [Candidatus Dormibacteria bacterium]